MPTYTPLQPNQTPTQGTSGDAVKALQTQYNTANPTATQLKVDGLYGPLTNSALNPKSTTASSSVQVPIITSNQSKTDYNNSVTTLTGANTALAGANAAPAATTTPAPVVTPPATTTTVTGTVANADGSKVDTNSDGTYKLTYANGESHNYLAGTDMVNAKLNQDKINEMVVRGNTLNADMEKYKKFNVDTDPAAVAKATSITNDYNTLIQSMKDKNAMLQGGYAKNSARSGMLQYANEMDTNFKSMELDKATTRVADLIRKRDDAISRSNEAFKSGNLKAFEAASKDYNQNLKETHNALDDLQKTILAQTKQNDAEHKQAVAEQRQETLDDFKITSSPLIGKALYQAMVDKGITGDPAKVQMELENYAKANNIGAASIETLRGAVIKAQEDQQKFNLSIANTKDIMKKRGQTKGGSYGNFTNKPTATAISKVNAYIVANGGDEAAIKAVNSNEAAFYGILNKVPVKRTSKFVAPKK